MKEAKSLRTLKHSANILKWHLHIGVVYIIYPILLLPNLLFSLQALEY